MSSLYNRLYSIVGSRSRVSAAVKAIDAGAGTQTTVASAMGTRNPIAASLQANPQTALSISTAKIASNRGYGRASLTAQGTIKACGG